MSAVRDTRRRFPRKRFWVPFALLLASYFLQPVWRMHELRNAAADADEVRILILAPDKEGQLTPEVVTIEGRTKAEELLRQISLRPSVLECLCGSLKGIEFAREGKPLVSLEYMGHALRWRSGKWWGKGELTGAAQANMCKWLETNGGEEYTTAQGNANKRWAKFRAKREAERPDKTNATQPATATASAPG